MTQQAGKSVLDQDMIRVTMIYLRTRWCRETFYELTNPLISESLQLLDRFCYADLGQDVHFKE